MWKKSFYKYAFISLLILGTAPVSNAQQFLSVGPMIHINFGGEKIRPSLGFEAAYWNYEHFPYSLDFGFEFEKSKFRLYSEAQTGFAFTGLSAGPVIEFKKGTPVQAGIQGSFWVNYYLGFDCRLRILKDSKIISPGIYAKLPFVVGPDSGNHNNSSDWDWD